VARQTASDFFTSLREQMDAPPDRSVITDTAIYRNPNYHTAADTAEKLDYGRMAQVVEGVYAAVIELAQ
jgi:hypothetical protein